MKKNPKILIVRADRLGDVVLTLPLAAAIKENLPEAEIHFLLSSYTVPLVKNNPAVSKVIALAEKKGKLSFKENLKLIKEENYDIALTVKPSFRLALILYLSGVKIRVGTGYRWYSLLFNRKVFEHRKYAEKHELEFNFGLLNQIGINAYPDPSNVSFGIEPLPEAERRVNEYLAGIGIGGERFVIVHPGSGGSAVDLPEAKMKELIGLLSGRFKVILTGSKNERELCERLSNIRGVDNAAGKFSLEELTALISRCALFIANSTGPLHIAAALGKHTVGFYPKFLAASPARWSPYSWKKLIYTPALNCSGCSRKQCEDLNCMYSIDVNIVFKDIQRLIDSTQG